MFFVFVLVLSDQIFGAFLRKLYFSSDQKEFSKLRYIIRDFKADVAIFGSSRSLHHFNAKMIEDSIGLKVYNCGFAGQGMEFSFLQFKNIIKNGQLKRVIVEVSPNILFDKESNEKLFLLAPFVKESEVIRDQLIGKGTDKIKFFSEVLPFNSLLPDLLFNKNKVEYDSLNGFEPLISKKYHRSNLEINYINKTNYLSNSIYYLSKIIEESISNKINITLVTTPYHDLSKTESRVINFIKDYTFQKYKIRFMDYSKFEKVYNMDVYFKDKLHLNFEGAQLFSSYFSSDYIKG